ncbi:hypothetical protein F5X99DRAFT_423389 [Biscogniauxia marginata]|nr:hypothetical protein F5X99DRAFT_423389 [Biscogniauxia marginata]
MAIAYLSIWYCCSCKYGPWNTYIDDSCPNCYEWRCVGCLEQNGKIKLEREIGIPLRVYQRNNIEAAGRYLLISQLQEKHPEMPHLTLKHGSPERNTEVKTSPADVNQVHSLRNYSQGKQWASRQHVSSSSTSVHEIHLALAEIVHQEQASNLDNNILGRQSKKEKVTRKQSISRERMPTVDISFDSIEYRSLNGLSRWHTTCICLPNEPVGGVNRESEEGLKDMQSLPGSSPKSRSKKTQMTRTTTVLDEENRDHLGESSANDVLPAVAEQDSRLACHFYKLNPLWYPNCEQIGHKTIGHLAAYLRKYYNDPYFCRVCRIPFDNDDLLQSHLDEGSCQRIGGISIGDLKVDKAHNIEGCVKWLRVWDELFPQRRRPQSPYSEPFEHLFQHVSHNFRINLERTGRPFQDIQDTLSCLMDAQNKHRASFPKTRRNRQLTTPQTKKAQQLPAPEDHNDLGLPIPELQESLQYHHAEGNLEFEPASHGVPVCGHGEDPGQQTDSLNNQVDESTTIFDDPVYLLQGLDD